MKRPAPDRPRPRATPRNPSLPPALRAALRRVRLFLCDVDGVLTNGTVLVGNRTEFKEFNIHDGLGLRLLSRHGIKVGWISNRPSPATYQRAEELKVDFLVQDGGSKVRAIEAILTKTGCGWREVCYLGDDVVDLGPLRRAGVAVAVANAIPEAKAAAHFVTTAEGGRGAVREVAGLLLRAQGKWEAVLQEHDA
ncbi:MAG TPA: HAD hydrolase family protein [Methylomirabilota bacterium]|nr:HAD hydrolase family protein [Methylomirabilota bacterium]